MLAVGAEALLEIASYSDCEIQVAGGAIRILHVDPPTVGVELMYQPGADRLDLAAKEPGGIDQMAAMGEHEVAALVGLGIALRVARLGALERDWLEVIRHGVAVGRIAVPRLQ